jgi:tRNA pseudouridine55 synthase
MPQRLLGLLNINKPAGLTSRGVVDHVARLVRPAKAGHAGTLDPLATGVLVVCVGSATRLISCVQQGRKGYRAKYLFGQRSDTDDITGTITQTAKFQPVSREMLETLLPAFIGRVQQVPPQFSAIHVNGKRAYKLARQGEQVDLQPRPVEIYTIVITDFSFPEVTMEIECGSGTYIRSIGRDLGEQLGCGAVMSELVRTRIGPFSLDEATELDGLTADTLPTKLIPPGVAVGELPRYDCTQDEEENLKHGRKLHCDHVLPFRENETIAVFTPEGGLACLAKYDTEQNLLSPKQVFLPRDC